ncbi:MBL fold metallo-hydrolase [Candidatus Palibaumannia cicadellinicola]|uniref:Metallo-beta-lactamase superfamily protein n=1 Tax=Baumannia cicadellinicola subsp. Homalodisca coagulata TaxID=374463 RepID=Q1LT65_BAUCH|nr:MBL fold metallo-hydrolase [Candidatus Baumannia cicadellinicola]ABF13863.1 metallo-beta-lactamase superfamily protein [Baumannia cicadellinicola str. Hc (Homalodisca coagulata)]MBS0032824.1 MBL fold metallo-hydrolase [Candidatus Baumannia cicadellinicola]MCJ7462111.1 MBL fold metallo-hydrolase [Candidatus Baumannia cicadellinicola]MCJ7462879.1 MBL fold metallo-hydrolase [Candidatus Baumannia cicadellinicola]
MKYHIIPVTIFNQNCSLIWCDQTKDAALIDPGGDASRLCFEIDKFNVTITQILLTHGHFDHVGAVKKLARYYDVPIIGPHSDDKILLENLSEQCKIFGVPPVDSFLPDRWLVNGDIIIVGLEKYYVLHCPGHSPGHIVLWNKVHRFIHMGDVLFKGAIGRTDLPGGNLTLLLRSINEKLFSLEDDITFLPGHGPMSTIGNERCSTYSFK